MHQDGGRGRQLHPEQRESRVSAVELPEDLPQRHPASGVREAQVHRVAGLHESLHGIAERHRLVLGGVGDAEGPSQQRFDVWIHPPS